MKVLFAVNNEKIAESITRKYQEEYKEIISSKTVYYFNAIIKELQKDKTYDRIVIGEDLEPFASDNYQAIDKYIFEKMDAISDEATNAEGDNIPIILIGLDRRTKNDPLLLKLFGLGLYDVLIGQDRSIQKVCNLMYKPRNKKEAKVYYKVETENVGYKAEKSNGVSESEIQNILTHYKKIGNNIPKCVQSFESINSQYSKEQIKLIIEVLPVSVKVILEENSDTYRKIMGIKGKKVVGSSKLREQDYVEKEINTGNKLTKPVIIPTTVSTEKVMKVKKENDKAEAKRKEEEKIAKEKAAAETKRKKEEKTIDEVEFTKRGRGRPRKNPVIIEEEVVPIKKKRGRPRKNLLDEIEENKKIEKSDEDEILNKDGQYNKSEDDFKIEDIQIKEIGNEEDFLPEFDDYEDEERFTLEFVSIEDAIKGNKNNHHWEKQNDEFYNGMFQRETKVLEMLQKELKKD